MDESKDSILIRLNWQYNKTITRTGDWRLNLYRIWNHKNSKRRSKEYRCQHRWAWEWMTFCYRNRYNYQPTHSDGHSREHTCCISSNGGFFPVWVCHKWDNLEEMNSPQESPQIFPLLLEEVINLIKSSEILQKEEESFLDLKKLSKRSRGREEQQLESVWKGKEFTNNKVKVLIWSWWIQWKMMWWVEM